MTETTLEIATQSVHESRCQNCGWNSMFPFYQCDDVPVHSCVLAQSRTEALDFRRGEIKLAFCDRCGFIGNLAFNSNDIDYSQHYEESQHFSQRFNQYANELVHRLTNEYGIRENTILEIGCGKASFLGMLCQAGNNRGIGIDPASDPARFAANEDWQGTDVTFYPEFFSEKHQFDADLICCRHTLEHIPNPSDFLRTVRTSIGNRRETLVFFEVPDTKRILKEQAFWDIYYEHCSYFTAQSLTHVFRNSGFEIVELRREFDDQYLSILAKPIDATSTQRRSNGKVIGILRGWVSEFSALQRQHVNYWQGKFEELRTAGRKAVVWGASSKSVAFLCSLGGGKEIEYAVDINPHKHEKFLPGTGQQILLPEFLSDYQPGLVILMNPIYREEVSSDLSRLGVSSELLTV